MVMALLLSIFTILRYHEQPSGRRLALAAVASAFALFIKPGICIFQIFGGFIFIGAYKRGIRKTLVGWHFAIFALVSVLPMIAYFIYGTFIAGFFGKQVGLKIMPNF